MLPAEVIKIIEEEILEHLSLNIKQLRDNHVLLQLRYKDKNIGKEYEIETKLGYFKDHGHGGHSFVDRVKLDVTKAK